MSNEESSPKRGIKRSTEELSSSAVYSSYTPSSEDFPATPRSIVTWNADGLAARAKNARNAIHEFNQLLQTTKADLVCIQEARLKCVSSRQRGTPMESELKEVEPVLKNFQSDYEMMWSLADKRQAGTLMLIHRKLLSGQGNNGNDDLKQCASDNGKSLLNKNVAFTVSGAIELLIKSYKLDDDEELKEIIKKRNNKTYSSYTQTPSSPIKKQKKQQTSMASFFKPKVKQSSTKSPPSYTKVCEHHHEGRIQFIRFADMDVLHTYVPNNGKDTDKFERRRIFDLDMQYFLVTRQKILEKASNSAPERPILWLGDLNVARTYMDGTDYTRNPSTGTVQEFWTDPIKCPDAAVRQPRGDVDPGTIGLPGFTPNERRRFEEMLNKAKLKDVWRSLHPNGIQTESIPFLANRRGGIHEQNPWNRAEYTWRGRFARRDSDVIKARYQGKGQRIDYFLLSENALDGVEKCHILGYG
eukprot:CAMPEP_0195290152 /NCGR_PEP_ID=MMETSP0707-20130614/6131_1 /TAXON_ID=33640 /ORGANISM="Asterionellopsis glacialis, Strain CCMP134" /LENGTH=469 /DNA_ID=CAMNT_0040350237 /DNA_START=33 /DNA_END=1439 /DNA_ORIENTATION=+